MGTNGGTISDYTPFSNAYQKVLEANAQPNAVIYAPRTWGDVDRLTDSTGQPLQPPQSYQDLETYQTTQVPIDQTQGTGTGLSTAFVGSFPQLLFGVRTDLRIEISRVASDGTNSAWEDLQVWVRAYLRADVQLAHPDHFCNITGISS
jgi:HK97 family phage major capsid protein